MASAGDLPIGNGRKGFTQSTRSKVIYLERKIRKPASLEAAKQEFLDWAHAKGYVAVRIIQAHLQLNLFTQHEDALIVAKARMGRST